MPKLEDLTVEGLEAAIQKLQAQAAEANGQQDELREELNRRIASEQAERMVEGLTPGELDVLIEAATARAAAGAEQPGGEA